MQGVGRLDYEDPSVGAEQDGWALRIDGWLLIMLAALPSAFIMDSNRDGSYFWTWFVLVVGGLGVGLIAVGGYLQSKGNVPMERLERWILSEGTKP